MFSLLFSASVFATTSHCHRRRIVVAVASRTSRSRIPHPAAPAVEQAVPIVGTSAPTRARTAREIGWLALPGAGGCAPYPFGIGNPLLPRTAPAFFPSKTPQTMPREAKSEILKLRISPSQKQQIKQNAKAAGASMSLYLLTLGLEGGTAEFGTQRRKAEGSLVNAKLYSDLGRLLGLFNQRQKTINLALKIGYQPPGDKGEVAEAMALLHQIRREIALKRLERT